jgi:hypothetical protein
LFNVYGLDAPTELGGVEHYIGDLVTTSEMVTSAWGDASLFFRHNDMAYDLEMHPEWKPYTPIYTSTLANSLEAMSLGDFKIEQRKKSGCPFAHLFE